MQIRRKENNTVYVYELSDLELEGAYREYIRRKATADVEHQVTMNDNHLMFDFVVDHEGFVEECVDVIAGTYIPLDLDTDAQDIVYELADHHGIWKD